MQEQVTSACPRPFVKWAGGKRQLLPVLSANMPESFGRYFEPFLGGGALFFHVMGGSGGRPCHVSDLNPDLILSYVTIRDSADELVRALRGHESRYREDPESYYYRVRDEYNAGRDCDAVDTVSRLIFLNKTCFNGLYRVNSRGRFNVPLGRYANPNIADAKNIFAISRALNSPNLEIACQDFGVVARSARKGDLVYFDPPYVPLSETASFTRYTGCDFGLDDQKKLADLCVTLDEMGCNVLLSNSNSDIVSEMFADESWTVERVQASRCINSDSRRRSGHHELLIRNY